jgi:hypothetical protein
MSTVTKRVSTTRPSHARRGAYAAAFAVVALGTFAGGACVSSSDYEAAAFACPTSDEFRWVSQVFERRCGTLDCHGSYARPFRIYGRTGLRMPGQDLVTNGSQATTSLEIDENRASACGLEPERMEAVLEGEADPLETLTLVRKPLLIEAHKGGRVLAEGSAGARCILSWLDGVVDTEACAEELAIP